MILHIVDWPRDLQDELRVIAAKQKSSIKKLLIDGGWRMVQDGKDSKKKPRPRRTR